MADPFDLNPEKSTALKARHSVSFEDVAIAFQEGPLLADMEHPGENYAHQRMAVVLIEDYAVPYFMDGDTMFLKTLFPSRKLYERFVTHPDDNDR